MNDVTPGRDDVRAYDHDVYDEQMNVVNEAEDDLLGADIGHIQSVCLLLVAACI